VRPGRAAALACAILCGCATADLGRSTLRGSDATGFRVADVPVRGFDVVLTTVAGSVEGELLAVDDTALWVRTVEGRPVPIARDAVTRVRVQVEDTSGGALAGWTTTGTLLTASHGLLLAITAPLWLLVGIPTSVLEAASGRADVEPRDFDRLSEYARFPQGPPPALTGEAPSSEPAAAGSPPEGWPTAPDTAEGAVLPPLVDAAAPVAPLADAAAPEGDASAAPWP